MKSPPIPLADDPFKYYPPICSWIFQVVSFPLFLHKTFAHLWSPPYVLHAPPWHSSRFDHPNNIGWAIQIIKLFIRQFSPLSCYSPLKDPSILLTNLFSNTLNLLSSLNVSDHVSHSHKITGKVIFLCTWIIIILDSVCILGRRIAFLWKCITLSVKSLCGFKYGTNLPFRMG